LNGGNLTQRNWDGDNKSEKQIRENLILRNVNRVLSIEKFDWIFKIEFSSQRK
jgi:hypothetical protein